MKIKKFFVSAICIIIALELTFVIHEYGHFREFQKRNITVEEFSLGIGPLLYQHKISSCVVSFRLVPIMAYVKPAKENFELFQKQGKAWDKIVVSTAGIRDNILVGLAIIFSFQFVGWREGCLSSREFIRTMLFTPIKIFLRFFSFIIGCLTFGRVNLTEKFLVSTGKINQPLLLGNLIVMNIGFSFVNIIPVYPLDGGYVAEAIMSSIGGLASIPKIPGYASFFVFILFLITANSQDYRIMECQSSN
ncbi:MAG: M50 family metallopeptidase [Patescibacteria group bacterium]